MKKKQLFLLYLYQIYIRQRQKDQNSTLIKPFQYPTIPIQEKKMQNPFYNKEPKKFNI